MARKIGSRYTAHQVIGRGSAGTVWLGEGPEGPVAIKLLREDLASDQVLVGRFVQERTALTSLDHPRVVGVHDLVVDGDDLALVMELVHGADLRSRLDREGPLTPQAAVSIAADVAEGLASLFVLEGDGIQAALMLGAAVVVRGTEVVGDTEIARTVSAARDLIGDAFDAAYNRGLSLSRPEALSLAGI